MPDRNSQLTDGNRVANSSRRQGLLGIAGGMFGLIPLAALAHADQSPKRSDRPAVAKRVVFLFMNGGPSQLDTFDPKPALRRYDGKSYSGETKIGSADRVVGNLWASPFRFQQHGESGIHISQLYPQLARHADDLCVIRSLHTSSALHAPALLNMNTGKQQLGGASLGGWVNYGLSRETVDLPNFVVMLDPRGGPINGHQNWPVKPLAVDPPAVIHAKDAPILNLQSPTNRSVRRDQQMQTLLRSLNREHADRCNSDDELTRRIRTYEQAWRMQQAAPAALDLSHETAATQQRYGLDRPNTVEFGTRCLFARRLLERGTQFVQLYSGGGAQADTWDSHANNNERHQQFAGETDRPIAALLDDLKQTGLWDDTLVIWGGEFGRTPTQESNSRGRDHNPHGFSMWLAGGVINGGHVIGATDEIGFEAVERPYRVQDLHATILQALGLNHESLTLHPNGTEFRLTGPEPCQVIADALVGQPQTQ